MALRGTGTGRRVGCPSGYLDEELTQGECVRRCRRTAAAPLFHDLGEKGRHLQLPQLPGLIGILDDESAAGPGLVEGCEVVRRQAMDRRRDEVVEDPWRAHDGRLLGIGERHPDDLDPKQRGIRVFVR